MIRMLPLFGLSMVLFAAPLHASEITGQYVEARTCDVWTGPCFANADFNLSGKNAVMAWKVKTGEFNNISLDGLGVVAVVSASDTLGVKQTGEAKVIFIVDKNADELQRKALIQMAQKQGGKLLRNIVGVQSDNVLINLCDCEGKTCAEVVAGKAKVKTRCLHTHHDKVCGNESAYYPPLANGVQARAAAAVEQGFTGSGLTETWTEFDNRGAYVGSFAIR